jgi:hypothetical protein
MKTIDIEIALMQHLNIRQNIVVPNVSFGIKRQIKFGSWLENEWDVLHECDILDVTPSGYATEYEIKVSKSNFLADKKKKHKHDSRFIKRLFYIVPKDMKDWALENLPEGAGLCFVTDSGRVYFIKNAPIRKNAFKWTNEEMFKLARLGAMRILPLKRLIKKQQTC